MIRKVARRSCDDPSGVAVSDSRLRLRIRGWRRAELSDSDDLPGTRRVYLYDQDWRLKQHIAVPAAEVALGRAFVHDGSTFEIFDVDSQGAFAVPPALLPRRVRYPWMRTETADLIAEALSTVEASRWREWSGDFDEWFNRIDDVLLRGAQDMIGWTLIDEAEADVVQRFLDRLHAIHAAIGDVPFDQYESHEGWSSVKAAAAEALAALRP